VPTHGRRTKLIRALGSIPMDEVDEVVVVDDNKIPLKIPYHDVPFLRTGGAEDAGGSFSRNTGMMSSGFSKVVYLDDDDTLNGAGSISCRAAALETAEIVWGDLYFESYYPSHPKLVRRVTTEVYERGHIFEDAVYTPLTGSQIAHVMNPDKFYWIVGGRKADKRFVLRARQLGAVGAHVARTVAIYGRKSIRGPIPIVENPGRPEVRSAPSNKFGRTKIRRDPRRHRR